jgi:hypothetical protein
MDVTMRLRFGYGSVVPWAYKVDGGIRAIAGPDSICLRTPLDLTGRDMSHQATFDVSAGDRVPFALIYQPSHKSEPRTWMPGSAWSRPVSSGTSGCPDAPTTARTGTP